MENSITTDNTTIKKRYARNQNVMVDIETLATNFENGQGPVIVSIGAVKFDEEEIIDQRYWKVSKASCENINMGRVDPETLKWIASSAVSLEAKKEFESSIDDIDIKTALTELATLFSKHTLVYARGICFDIPILEAAYKNSAIEIPWKFYNVRDTRIIFDWFKTSTEKNMLPHHALHDALYETKIVLYFFNHVKQINI